MIKNKNFYSQVDLQVAKRTKMLQQPVLKKRKYKNSRNKLKDLLFTRKLDKISITTNNVTFSNLNKNIYNTQ